MTDGYVVNNYGDPKSLIPGVVGPLPNGHENGLFSGKVPLTYIHPLRWPSIQVASFSLGSKGLLAAC